MGARQLSWLKKLFGERDAQPGADRIVPLASGTIPSPDGDQPLHQDQVLRKQWSQSVLEGQGVPYIDHLPCIEGEAETTLRTVREVADRLLALTIVAVKGEGLEQEHVLDIVTSRNVRPLFSPSELAFIDSTDPSEHDRIQFCWRYEAAWVMFWALNFTKGPMSVPTEICDVPLLVQTVKDIENLACHGMQSANNILNEADLIYRYHWAVRQARIDGKSPPANLNPGAVMERHHALNWLINYGDADWDDVGTET
jgi:hypothetical protein